MGTMVGEGQGKCLGRDPHQRGKARTGYKYMFGKERACGASRAIRQKERWQGRLEADAAAAVGAVGRRSTQQTSWM